MADRVKDIAKKSGSRLHVGKGSINHIGAAPYRFKLDIFISYVDNIKNASEVCVTWERRGKTEATTIAKVKENKAVFRQALTMDLTLFRRDAGAGEQESLKFDEKKAKFQLRKGGPDGKALGKLAMNLAEYVRGTTSTVFADMKLSNGSVIVAKIEATMLHVGKKKKGGGGRTGSEACSEMTDVNSAENDSLFGDDDQDLGDVEIEITPPPPEFADKNSITLSPVSSTLGLTKNSSSGRGGAVDRESETGKLARRVENMISTESSRISGSHSSLGVSTSKRLKNSAKGAKDALKEEEDLKNSPSLKDKIKGKIRGKKDNDNKDKEKVEKHKDKDKAKDKYNGKDDTDSKRHSLTTSSKTAEVAELKGTIESLKKENGKLKKAKQAAMDEIEALRTDLEACEVALEEAKASNRINVNGAVATPTFDMSKTLKGKDKRIAELEAQNESLLEELEELHEDAADSAVGVADGQMRALQKKIEELEIALKREPQYMDVVNELKVTKVSLALANMEKEQALFALQSHNAAIMAQNMGDSD